MAMMKRTLLLLMALVCISLTTRAQDIITLTDGSKLRAKVLEINPDDIKYKDFTNQDGPVITIQKNTVADIRYANGTKTVINAADNNNNDNGNRPRSGSFHRGADNGDTYNSYNSGNGRTPYQRKKQKAADIKGWYFGLNVPLGISSATNDDPSYTTSGDSYSALIVLATKMFDRHFGLQFGMGIETYSYAVQYGPNSQYSYANDLFTLGEFCIPVRVLYLSQNKTRAGLYVSAGVDLAFLAIASDQENENLGPLYNKTLLTPYISAGVNLRTRGGRGVWMFGPYFKTTISNFYSNAYGDNGILNSGGLSLQYMGKFGRR